MWNRVNPKFKSWNFYNISIVSAFLFLAIILAKPSSNLAITLAAKQLHKSESRRLPQLTAQKQATAKSHYTTPTIEIRVAIALHTPALTIGSSTSAYVLDPNGSFLQELPARASFAAQSSDSTILLAGKQSPVAVWIQATNDGYIYVGNHWYRGRVLLIATGSTLLAVNYVDLEKYLYSVVGSEMSPNAPEEALKAQAIAARSYALVQLLRPASDWYDLGATEHWQVYKGLDTEYNTTHTAVDETGGQILSYQGGIVESLYAASQAIVNKVHRGFGMSQTGAYQMAAQGYDYRQILAVYYPGTELAQLKF